MVPRDFSKIKLLVAGIPILFIQEMRALQVRGVLHGHRCLTVMFSNCTSTEKREVACL
jgi:hypothetical protein